MTQFLNQARPETPVQLRGGLPGRFSEAKLRPASRGFSAGALFTVLLSLSTVGSVRGQDDQVRWTVDPKTSLAWFQIEPHYSHLWATTCPDDPSWQPGEGWTPGVKEIDYSTRPKFFAADVRDPRIPMFPRGEVSPVCRQAVQGEVTAGDTVSWTGVTGRVALLPDSLLMGLTMRDAFLRKKLFETHKYGEIRFTLDSLIAVQPGDTLRATAIGIYELRGVRQPIESSVLAWRESGVLRVLAQWKMDAQDLVKVYGMSRWALGLAVALRRWRIVHMGVDLMMTPEPQS